MFGFVGWREGKENLRPVAWRVTQVSLDELAHY